MRQTIWFFNILEEIGCKPLKPIVFEDNKSTLALVTAEIVKSSRNRWMKIRRDSLHEEYVEGSVAFCYCVPEQMLAD